MPKEDLKLRNHALILHFTEPHWRIRRALIWSPNRLMIPIIKAVAQATPTYTMSCFKIPDSLCTDLNSMMSKFWWGQKDREKKLAWVSWEKLCTPKSEGGMGFRGSKSL